MKKAGLRKVPDHKIGPLNRNEAPPAPSSDIELRRWCIEQAARWPIETVHGYGAIQGGINVGQQYSRETDLLGRADRIFKWIKAS